MGLQAQPPLRMRQAVLDRQPGVLLAVGAVHRLQQQVREVQVLEPLRRRAVLRIDQLQFVAAGQRSGRAGLRADADPVEPAGAAWVPLVSTATSNPAACRASTAASSSWSSGSPPVHTT